MRKAAFELAKNRTTPNGDNRLPSGISALYVGWQLTYNATSASLWRLNDIAYFQRPLRRHHQRIGHAVEDTEHH